MNWIWKTTVTGAVLLGAQKNVSAQYQASKYELGLHIGTLIYQGDLSAARLGYTKNLKPAIGISLSRVMNPYFSVRANLTRGKLGADESTISDPAYKKLRNFKFSTPVTELSAMLVWNVAGDNAGRKLNYYFLGGAGVGFLNIKRDWHSINSNFFDDKSQAMIGLGKDTVHSTPRITPVFPVGAGLRYQLSKSISLHAEALYRITLTDCIDGFKYSVNPAKRDSYYGVSVGVHFKLGNNQFRCPEVNK